MWEVNIHRLHPHEKLKHYVIVTTHNYSLTTKLRVATHPGRFQDTPPVHSCYSRDPQTGYKYTGAPDVLIHMAHRDTARAQ